MPPNFKTEEIIYDNLKTGIQAEIPTITNWSIGAVTRTIAVVTAAAIRSLYVTLQSLYFNMFPQHADIETLKRYYDEWGLTWDDPTLETARQTVLNKYQENSVIGTKTWYEETVKAQFPIVTDATLMPNYRGAGTADLMVWRNNRTIYGSDIDSIQAFFDLDANKVIGMDLLVKSTGEENAGAV
jgi:uncharacterized phage protein gp47/JayE